MKKHFTLILLLIIIALSASFVGCTKSHSQGVDYSKENDYEYEISDEKNYVTYSPKDVSPTYGLLFYLGTAIAPEKYDYLASALAKQGYLVVISKNALALVTYKKEEPAFAKYQDVKFFLGGHSQGGGAAVKRAKENLDATMGLVLLAPLAYEVDSVADKNVPTLLINAKNDGVLTDVMKATSKNAVPLQRTEYLIDGAHMSFSTYDDDTVLKLFNDGPASAEVKAEQRRLTVEYTLAFLKDTIAKTPMPI